MFCLTHKRKDGSMISVAAQQVVDEFETLSRSELESSEHIDEDEIYHQVVGNERHGRVHGYGLGPTSTFVFGANPCRLELLGKLTEANKLNEKMLTKVEELEKKKMKIEGKLRKIAKEWRKKEKGWRKIEKR
ncbi:hypothetical protein CRYUN_Cryun24cG0040800 [Craigia yunnanensis]